MSETKSINRKSGMRTGGNPGWLRSNYHWIVLGVFVLLLLVLHRFILLTGDDYMHSGVLGLGSKGFWDWHIHHYLRGNGRAIIHFFLTLAFAVPDAEIQRLFNPFIIALVLFLGAKLCTSDKEQFRRCVVVLCLIFLCLFGLFMSMGIYSFTPAFNYVHPMILTFGVALWTRKLYDDPSFAGRQTGACTAAYLILSFLAGASMEQTGIMTIGYIILIALSAYVREKRKPAKSVAAALILCVAGYLTVMLAPGNFVRMGTSTKPFMENFIAGSTMLINTKSLSLFNLLFVLCMIYWLIRERAKNKLLFVFNICVCIGLAAGCMMNLFLLFNPFGYSFESGGVIALIWRGYDLLYIFSAVYVPLWIAYMRKDWTYAIHMCIALGAIFILLFASISPYRPLIPSVLTMMLFMAKTLLSAFERRTVRIAACAVLAVMAAAVFCVNLRGYYLNYVADKENMEIIDQFLAAETQSGEVHLHPYADYEASAYSINRPGVTYAPDFEDEMYLGWYKVFCGLPQDTTLCFDLD